MLDKIKSVFELYGFEPLATPAIEYVGAPSLTFAPDSAAAEVGVPFTTNHAGTMFGGFFTATEQVQNYAEVMACDTERFNHFFHLMLDAGVYLAPASYEAGFMSSAHSDADIEATIETKVAALRCHTSQGTTTMGGAEQGDKGIHPFRQLAARIGGVHPRSSIQPLESIRTGKEPALPEARLVLNKQSKIVDRAAVLKLLPLVRPGDGHGGILPIHQLQRLLWLEGGLQHQAAAG